MSMDEKWNAWSSKFSLTFVRAYYCFNLMSYTLFDQTLSLDQTLFAALAKEVYKLELKQHGVVVKPFFV